MGSETENYLSGTTPVIAIFIGILSAFLIYILKLFRSDGKSDEPQTHNENRSSVAEKKKDQASGDKVTKKKIAEKKYKIDKQGFTDPWLVKSLKGHTGEILDVDFSGNNKYIVSCADDRSVFLWDFKDITHGEHKSLRVNIEFDYATFVKWSPDSKAFIIHKYNGNCIEVYKVEKKKDAWLGPVVKVLTFPKRNDDDVIAMAIASNGKFIITCTNKTDLVVWDLKGNILANEDTCLMTTTCAKISPCGRFIVASGFSPDAKVWEVLFSKSNEFQEVKRVFELTGHTSGIYDVAFDVDSSHMATVSKDGTWRLYDTKIEYKKGEDPRFLISGQYDKRASHALIALSSNAEVVVIAAGNSLSFYMTWNGTLDRVIDKVCNGNITSVKFDATGKYVLCSGDRHIRVFLNITGVRRDLQMIEEKLKQQQTTATRERLEQQKTEALALINSLKK